MAAISGKAEMSEAEAKETWRSWKKPERGRQVQPNGPGVGRAQRAHVPGGTAGAMRGSSAGGGGTETPFPPEGARASLRRSRSRSLYRRIAPDRISLISALYSIPAALAIN